MNDTPEEELEGSHPSCALALDAWCGREGVDGDTYFRLSKRLHQWWSSEKTRGAIADEITDQLLRFLASVEELGYDELSDLAADIERDVRKKLARGEE